jgi:hypothetical protein
MSGFAQPFALAHICILMPSAHPLQCYDALAFVSMSQYAYGVACDNLHFVLQHRFPELLAPVRAQVCVWGAHPVGDS